MIIIKQQAAPSPGAEPKRKVFLVHGRDLAAKTALVELLRAFDLKIVTWDDASASTKVPTPYTGDIVLAGLQLADAVVVLMTPDDVGSAKPEFLFPNDADHERTPTPQARLNVIFEAGMALALNRDATVLLEVGEVRPMSDTAGLNVVRFTTGSASERLQLAGRLRTAGLQVDLTDSSWTQVGEFPHK